MTSTEIEGRKTEIQAEIAAKRTRLSELPQQKKQQLSASPPDLKQLEKLEREETEIPLVISRLESRLLLLAEQEETALKSEAEHRLQEIVSTWQTFSRQVSEETKSIKAVVDSLLPMLDTARATREAFQTVSDEARFLVLRHGLPRVHAPTVETFTKSDLKSFVSRAEECLQQSFWNEWASQCEQLQNERQQRLQEEERRKPERPIMKVNDPQALNKALEKQREEQRQQYAWVPTITNVHTPSETGDIPNQSVVRVPQAPHPSQRIRELATGTAKKTD